MDKSNKIENLANKYVERHIRDRHLSDDTIKEIKIAYIMIIKDFIAIVDKSTSIICRGNDGLPFNVDNLTIPYGKWRKESIKAYGNAIVPLIAVKIFEMINKIEGYEQQTTL